MEVVISLYYIANVIAYHIEIMKGRRYFKVFFFLLFGGAKYIRRLYHKRL